MKTGNLNSWLEWHLAKLNVATADSAIQLHLQRDHLSQHAIKLSTMEKAP